MKPAKKFSNPPPSPLIPEIRGQLTARRALEVAMVRNHTTALIGPTGSGRHYLAAAFPTVRTVVMDTCPCGYLRSAGNTCVCTPSTLEVYAAVVAPVLHELDIAVEVCEVPAKYWEAPGMQPEDWEHLHARVRAAQSRVWHAAALDLADDAASRTREMIVRRCGLSCQGYASMMQVARTIAALDAAPAIMAKHLAEAVQYLPAVVVRQWWSA